MSEIKYFFMVVNLMNKAIRYCGSSWEYCDGICNGCAKSKTKVDKTTYDYERIYHKETTTDGKFRRFLCTSYLKNILDTI